MYLTTTYDSPVGRCTIACDESGSDLVGLWIEGQKYHGGLSLDDMKTSQSASALRETATWLDQYFAGEEPAISMLNLKPVGTSFRMAVWQILQDIPYGQLTTYGEIARQMAVRSGKKSMSSQAVGGAVGHNPISIIIPCHRVVGADGSLTGYAGGLETKIRLLELEGTDMSDLYTPTKGTAL